MKFFARKIRKEEDPKFKKWPIDKPRDIVKWESIKDNAETRIKYKTRQRYNEKAARMEAKWKQFKSEQARVENILDRSVRKLNEMMTDRVNALYNRSYKAFIKKDNKGKDKEMELNNNQLDQIKKVMDEELDITDNEEEEDKKRIRR